MAAIAFTELPARKALSKGARGFDRLSPDGSFKFTEADSISYTSPQGERTMSAVTFDTLKFVKTLQHAGFNPQQAEALAQAQQTAISESAELILATKDDTNLIRADVMKVDAEIRLLKWMTGATFAAVMAILIRLFLGLPH